MEEAGKGCDSELNTTDFTLGGVIFFCDSVHLLTIHGGKRRIKLDYVPKKSLRYLRIKATMRGPKRVKFRVMNVLVGIWISIALGSKFEEVAVFQKPLRTAMLMAEAVFLKNQKHHSRVLLQFCEDLVCIPALQLIRIHLSIDDILSFFKL